MSSRNEVTIHVGAAQAEASLRPGALGNLDHTNGNAKQVLSVLVLRRR
jgi:hypothetical protein